MAADPPNAIRTERLLLRCWNPEDAGALKEAVDSSVEHLRPWMPWITAEPQTLKEKVQLLRGFRGRFDLGQDFVYGVFDRDGTEVVGGTGLHTRVGPDAYEIGYWIRESHAGRGFATELSAALTRVAFELCDVDRVEIHCQLDNVRSLAVPRKLGYREEARLARRLTAADGIGLRDAVVHTLFRSEYAGTPSAEAAIEAFDAAGAQVL
jgi:RimJ/RimL family protein N-acetyltransferase